jgi:hypothetical protein
VKKKCIKRGKLPVNYQMEASKQKQVPMPIVPMPIVKQQVPIPIIQKQVPVPMQIGQRPIVPVLPNIIEKQIGSATHVLRDETGMEIAKGNTTIIKEVGRIVREEVERVKREMMEEMRRIEEGRRREAEEERELQQEMIRMIRMIRTERELQQEMERERRRMEEERREELSEREGEKNREVYMQGYTTGYMIIPEEIVKRMEENEARKVQGRISKNITTYQQKYPKEKEEQIRVMRENQRKIREEMERRNRPKMGVGMIQLEIK